MSCFAISFLAEVSKTKIRLLIFTTTVLDFSADFIHSFALTGSSWQGEEGKGCAEIFLSSGGEISSDKEENVYFAKLRVENNTSNHR